MRKHVLILANGFVNDAPRALPTELLAYADPASEMHVLAPVHLTRLQSVCSDLDQPRAEAQERLDRILQDMTSLGLSVTGETADENQLLAIEDALAQSNAHAIVVVTHVPGQQNWRERQLIANVARFQLPVKDVLITRDGSIAIPSPRGTLDDPERPHPLRREPPTRGIGDAGADSDQPADTQTDSCHEDAGRPHTRRTPASDIAEIVVPIVTASR